MWSVKKTEAITGSVVASVLFGKKGYCFHRTLRLYNKDFFLSRQNMLCFSDRKITFANNMKVGQFTLGNLVRDNFIRYMRLGFLAPQICKNH